MDPPPPDTLNRHWKDDKSRFGFKMLQKMGWTEEKGLGKDDQGLINNVKVTKKVDGHGLGMTSDGSGNSSWASTATSFNDVLQLLQSSYGGDSTKKKKKASKSTSIKIGVK
jgi:Pin2-interacting protein X1